MTSEPSRLCNRALKEAFLNIHSEIVRDLRVDDIVDNLIPPRILTPREVSVLRRLADEREQSAEFMLMMHESPIPDTFIHLFQALQASEKNYDWLVEKIKSNHDKELARFSADHVEGSKKDAACSSRPSSATQPHKNDEIVKDETHILVIGESGVGKSTWINALACYLQFPTFKDAMASDCICPIPATFTLRDSNLQPVTISYKGRLTDVLTCGGDATIEGGDAVRSVTQCPCSYKLQAADMCVHVIDTPGMGCTDREVVQRDKEHLSMIIDHISHYEKLHGIVFLLKANDCRLQVWIKYCVKELMANLHRDAVKNVVFCFTHARLTMYKAGDGFNTLERLLNEIEDNKFAVNMKTIYHMDNEAVRYLITSKNFTYSDYELACFERSWEWSAAESKRLIRNIAGLQPHDTRITVSFIATSKKVKLLLRPLAELINQHQHNIDLIDQNINKQVASERLKVATRTVCTNAACKRASKVELLGRTYPLFNNPCHDSCRVPFFWRDTKGSFILRFCGAIDIRGICKICECSMDHHMCIDYETRYKVIDGSVTNQPDEFALRRERLAKRKEELVKERNKMLKISASFGCFLKQNAIIYVNDAFIDMLNIFVNQTTGSSPGDLLSMEALRQKYLDEKQSVELAVRSGETSSGNLTAPQILAKCEKLYELKHAGQVLKDAAALADQCYLRRLLKQEQRIKCALPIRS